MCAAVRVVFAAYRTRLQTHPRTTAIAQAGAIYSVSDVAAQKLFSQEPLFSQDGGQARPVDWDRTRVAAGAGVIMSGLIIPAWYRNLDRVFGAAMDSYRIVGLKIVADSAIFGPFSLVAYSFNRHVLEHAWSSRWGPWFERARREGSSSPAAVAADCPIVEDAAAVWGRLRTIFWPMTRAEWTIWPAYNAICFSRIPPEYRPLTTAVVSALWSFLLSATSNSPDGLVAAEGDSA